MPSDLAVPVAVCVVTHDARDDLQPFFAALDRLVRPPAELVVIDSGSRDGTVERLARQSPDRLPMTVEVVGANVGFAAGMNRALELSRSRWVLSLNADCRPDPDFIERLLSAADGDRSRRVAAVTGKLRRATGDEGVRLDACGMIVTPAWRHHDRGSGEPDRGRYDRRAEVFGATGAAVLLRRRALLDVAVDGAAFAEEFHSYREDAELAFRLRERGWSVVYEPTAGAEHRRRVTPARRSRLPAEINYHSLKNRYLLRAYHQSVGNLLWTLLPTLVRDLGALLYVLTFERSSLEAYRWLWRHRRQIARKRRVVAARRTVRRSAIERWFWIRELPA